jgi:lauroyl/myristoyl acyltransferase
LNEIEQKELQDVEQLCYLGMRAAFGREQSRRALRLRARSCTVRKFRTLHDWAEAGPFPPMRVEGGSHLRVATRKGRGAIVCAPHVGPYHRIPLELVERNHDVTLLLDTINFEREKNWYSHWRRQYKGALADPMQYINAELPQAAWEMARALRSGRILFVYVDGNAGLESTETARNLVEVVFCGLRIRVRKGLSYVSAFVGAPIVPVIARYTNRAGHVMRFEAPLEKNRDESADVYCRRTLQQLFSLLEQYVKRDPACWEEWSHVHRWQVREQLPRSTQVLRDGFQPEEVLGLTLAADADNVELLRMSEGDVLTNVRSGAALLVTEPVAGMLRVLDGRLTVGEVLDRLSGRYDEALLLEVLHALCTGGFVTACDVAQRDSQRYSEIA